MFNHHSFIRQVLIQHLLGAGDMATNKTHKGLWWQSLHSRRECSQRVSEVISECGKKIAEWSVGVIAVCVCLSVCVWAGRGCLLQKMVMEGLLRTESRSKWWDGHSGTMSMEKDILGSGNNSCKRLEVGMNLNGLETEGGPCGWSGC